MYPTVDQEFHTVLPDLVSHRRCTERIHNAWPDFQSKRLQRLEQQQRLGEACEKVAENILEDLFTSVLDYPDLGLLAFQRSAQVAYLNGLQKL